MKTKCSLQVGGVCVVGFGFFLMEFGFFLMEFEIFCFHQYILIYPLLFLKPEGCFSGQKAL